MNETTKRTELDMNVTDSIKVLPDTLEFKVLVGNNEESLENSYEKAVLVGTEAVNRVMEVIQSFGVTEKENLKQRALNINAVYTHVYVEDKKRTLGTNRVERSYENRLVGYKYEAVIEISLPVENENKSKLYCKLNSLNEVVSVDLKYSIKEIEKWHDELIEKLIDKARHKANVIAEASMLEVESIAEINMNSNYGNYSRGVQMDGMCFMNSAENSVNEYMKGLENTEKEIKESINVKFILTKKA